MPNTEFEWRTAEPARHGWLGLGIGLASFAAGLAVLFMYGAPYLASRPGGEPGVVKALAEPAAAKISPIAPPSAEVVSPLPAQTTPAPAKSATDAPKASERPAPSVTVLNDGAVGDTPKAGAPPPPRSRETPAGDRPTLKGYRPLNRVEARGPSEDRRRQARDERRADEADLNGGLDDGAEDFQTLRENTLREALGRGG